MALIVASVPELTILTISTLSISSHRNFAIWSSNSVGAPKAIALSLISFMAVTTSSLQWPNIIGPHANTKSIYSLPSSSLIITPFPLFITGGFIPISLYALTGELTPPGIYSFDLINISSFLINYYPPLTILLLLLHNKSLSFLHQLFS